MNKRRLRYFICYLFVLVFTWVLIGQIIQVSLTVDKLVKVNGVISRSAEVKKKKYKSRRYNYELRIYLRDTNEYFRFMDIYHYNKFRYKLHAGDSAAIYIRPKWLVPLGLGYRNDIFQMSVNGETVFEIAQTRRNARGIIIVSIIAILAFIFIAHYRKHKVAEGT